MNNASLSAARISSCKQLELLRREQNAFSFGLYRHAAALFQLVNSSAKFPLGNCPSQPPVTFAKFGATCNKRKMLHQSSCRCRKREVGLGCGGGVQTQINKPVEALPVTISWVRWWENFSALSGDIICEHVGVLRSPKVLERNPGTWSGRLEHF